MKTAMQELQEKITALINDSKETGSNRDNPDYRIGLHQALGLIDLEAEKEQMENFHIEVMKHGLIEEGDKKWRDAYLPKIRETAEQYYQQNYNQEQ